MYWHLVHLASMIRHNTEQTDRVFALFSFFEFFLKIFETAKLVVF